jgi:2,4-dienoyl-CoA reductase-like NADH-dependent reductase (Old Yellow Enzyme family)
MSKEDGERLIENGLADALAFGRDYIATPDLAERLQMGLPLNTPDKETFYGEGRVGYTDYPRLAPVR